MIAKDGHEIGIHGYSHENPLAMSPQQERDVLDKSIELCRGLTGKNPKGYATPWAEFTSITVDLLLERGISHEFSMMEEDCFPYYLRTGDSWTKIDYSKNAEDWMKPWKAGREVDIVEIPLSWHLDDAPPTMFVKTAPNSHGWITGQQLGQIWIDYFDWIYRNHDYAIYPLALHPDAAAKPHLMLALERLIDHILRHRGARMVTHAEMAADFRKRVPFGSNKTVGGEVGL